MSGDRPGAVRPATPPPLDKAGSTQAPFVYFDGVTSYGALNAVIQVTLEAVRLMPGAAPGATEPDRVVVAHLRMSVAAAAGLRAALDAAIGMSG